MDVLANLTPLQILTPVVLALAAFGYVRLLAAALWLTLLGTAALAGLLSLSYPFVASNALGWGGAALLVLGAIVLSRLGRAPAPVAPPREQIAAKDRQDIAIDGTNVLYWDGEDAELASLRLVVYALVKRKFAPVVFLDASSRHHLKDKSLTEKDFAKALGLPQNRVMVCPAGTEADAFLLQYAKENNMPVVSNDQFRDRAQIAGKLRLVRGIFANGKPIFEGL
ncbi:hypothetical protein A8B82_19665 [Sulfitobacter sp. EhC04]|uniref:NYN domain-containing protein n=1 Tax=Sulfitobacter sp. EhC04 TaxID=1849168 RepID=UPI0007F55D1E|nr:hypothetical protein [Sulfitobacter sp. EhC04]OAN72891.1 hypothetical protein A8B82_19665 [Sulfitobacter sp. EhC04]